MEKEILLVSARGVRSKKSGKLGYYYTAILDGRPVQLFSQELPSWVAAFPRHGDDYVSVTPVRCTAHFDVTVYDNRLQLNLLSLEELD